MKVTVERASDSEAVLNVELEWGEVEKASDRAYHRLVQRYNVPGFRRGHAPRSMLERMIGKETLYQEGLESLIEDSYREAIRSNDLTPLAEPTLEAPPLQMNQPYTFVARVPVLAPVRLGDYKSVRVEQPSVEVTDEDVEKVLLDMQQQQALWIPADRPAQVGDQIVADVHLVVGDRSISDLHDNEFVLAETREGIFTGMDEHIMGMSEGDTKEFTTTIPADYANDKLAGQQAQYTVTLKAVKVRELPEIDDELAKTAGEYQTLDELCAGIRAQLTTRRETNARRDFREQLIKAVVDQAEVEVHSVLVQDEAGVMAREMQRLLENNGLSMEQYLGMMNKTEEEYRAELEPEARERVKRELVLNAIADAEGIAISDREVENWLDMMNALGGGKPIRLRQLSAGQRLNIANRLRRDKVTTQLVRDAGGEPADADEDAHDHAVETEYEEEMSAPEASAAHAAQVGVALATETPAAAAPEARSAGTTNGKAAGVAEDVAADTPDAGDAAETPSAAEASPDATEKVARAPDHGA